jgi:hypothetical protein
LVLAALGLPVNDLFRFGLLGTAMAVVFAGTMTTQLAAWAGALAIVVIAVLGQALLPTPRIDEGHNVFLLDDGRSGALERGLPAEVFRHMAAEFDARYPREKRCDPRVSGCWRGLGFPERTFAFSADGIYGRPAFSRRVTHIDISDPVWLRLGFINEAHYNWYGASDVQREKRERGLLKVLHPWQLLMPHFVMVRFPAEFAGSWLCWRGTVLWEGDGERFTVWRHADTSCRPIEAPDIGRRVFGVAVASPLTMSLEASVSIQLRRLVEPGLALLATIAVLMLLVRWRHCDLALPVTFLGLSIAVVVLNDASFVGGFRPFEGGDDGLFYEGVGRRIAQHLRAGEWALALEGGEKVFYYGGPGLRYLRALERFVFGDSFLGYLLAILAMPFVVLAVFQRFFSVRAALALTLIFIALPVGALFGTSYFHYAKWAARGFADPAAAIAFLAGFVVLIGRTPTGPGTNFAPALSAGALFALALWLRPNLAPGAAVLLGGAGLAALWQLELRRLAGLCIGFAPVFGMALHNWYFGGVFVLFSSNATEPSNFPMPPSAYVSALSELVRLDFSSGSIVRALKQWIGWLSGPSESALMVPLHILAVAVVLRIAIYGRGYEFALRLAAASSLALHLVAWFYPTATRYHLVTWFLTLLVCAVWTRDKGIALARRYWPGVVEWFERHPASGFWARVLDRLART